MFNFLESKNKRLVKKWKKEHEELVVLGQEVIGEYVKNDHQKTKQYLEKFVDLAVEHLSSEDIELYKLLNEPEKNDPDTDRLVKEFQKSFKNTKVTLMKFLAKYVKPEEKLDDVFFDTFNSIMEILGKRIAFENENLYFRLSLS